MEYFIRIPKESRSVIPLELVVHEIARGFATRWGEQPFHRATFKEVERRYSAKIVEAAKRGNLRVCDMDGFTIQNITDELVHRESISEDAVAVAQKEHPECEIAPGMWNFSGIDFDHARESEVRLVGLFITLDDLNKWAKHTGDSFRIEEMPVEVTDVDGIRYTVSAANSEKSAAAAGSRGDAVIVGAGTAKPSEPSAAKKKGGDRLTFAMISGYDRMSNDANRPPTCRALFDWLKENDETGAIEAHEDDVLTYRRADGGLKDVNYKAFTNRFSRLPQRKTPH